MASYTDRLLGFFGLQRAFNPFTPAEWAALAQGFNRYPTTTYNRTEERITTDFEGIVAGAYASSPIVFACENARVQLFSEARFQYQKMVKGRPGERFGTDALAILEEPWPGGTTSQLLKDALLDADLAGNGFILRESATSLRRLRPDWVTLIAGNPRTDGTTWDLDTQLLGIGYQPDGPLGGKDRVFIPAGQFAHFKSTHDPLRRFSGMPWLFSALREINSDQASTAHKLKFYENGATPNLAIQFDQTMTLAQAKDWKELFQKEHEGTANAFKTLFLGGGATAVPIGANLRQSDYTSVQAAGELRIASAAGVPPIIVGLAGGLDAATYSNYGQARRAFADLTMRPLWRDMAGALESIIPTPTGTRLWFDDRDISFLQEDVKDAAEIQSTQAAAIRQLVDGGYEPASVIEAITANDFSRLKHTKLFSVQLQPPGTVAAPPPEPAAPDATAPASLLNAGHPVGEVRCPDCNRLVAKRTAPGGGVEVKCRGCSALVAA